MLWKRSVKKNPDPLTVSTLTSLDSGYLGNKGNSFTVKIKKAYYLDYFLFSVRYDLANGAEMFDIIFVLLVSLLQ